MLGRDMAALVAEDLPALMDRLRATERLPWSATGRWPAVGGIYVLWEGSEALYVGRTGNLKQRLRQHGQRSSTHYSASFAFNLAKGEAQKSGLVTEGRKRGELQADPAFSDCFERAKERVRQMHVTAIEVASPILQTLFEVYVHLELGTRYNDFENH